MMPSELPKPFMDNIIADTAADTTAGIGDSLLNGFVGKIKERINSGVEGQLLDSAGLDADSLLVNEDDAGWFICLMIVMGLFMLGGFAEALITITSDDNPSYDVNIENEHYSETRIKIIKKPFVLVIVAEAIALLVSVAYTPLTLTLPILAVHQVSRVTGMAIKGRAIGGQLMRFGVVGIIIGVLLTSLFGYHHSLIPHGWEKIIDAFSNPIFDIWAVSCLAVAGISLIIAYVSPVRNVTGNDPHEDDVVEEKSTFASLACCLRIRCCVYLLNVPVPWNFKCQAFAAVTGILASFLLLIVQQVTLSFAKISEYSHLMGFQTFILAFLCGLYLIICIVVFRRALTKFETTKFLPSFMCWTISIGTLNETFLQMICFSAYDMTFIRFFLYLLGLIMTCTGLQFMGVADVRQQLENLQYLASEISRLGILIDGAFIEAGQVDIDSASEGRDVTVSTSRQNINHQEIGMVEMRDSLGGDSNRNGWGADADFEERRREAISTAFSIDGDNDFVQTILSNVGMEEGHHQS